MTDWIQRIITLPKHPRGFHLITDFVLREMPELSKFEVGFLQIFIQHTSASLTLNENADPTFESIWRLPQIKFALNQVASFIR